MTAYRNRESYVDCYLAMDEALRTGRVVIKHHNFSGVFNDLQRFTAARRRQMAENARIYPYGHQMHGRSVYDGLNIQGSRLTNELTISVEKEADDV